ncbi:hypothetical protein BM221_001430 [Beauveria bassiana]|uniref:Uncharacterized protein n=1 Tax=Beauveria bassiana TaxID=176275 RepID=A0A2N6P394_BEABA|nr:hypothetical protein BM221_001430 [Beauveria bassiana]
MARPSARPSRRHCETRRAQETPPRDNTLPSSRATSSALGAMTGIPIYMLPYATGEPVTPTERDIDAAEKLLKWLIKERGDQEVSAVSPFIRACDTGAQHHALNKDQSLHHKELCAMNCPDTVALWTEFLNEVKRGELEPRFPANRLSRKAKKSRDKKAEKQDVELYMSYLFVARAGEPGSDSDNVSGSSD